VLGGGEAGELGRALGHLEVDLKEVVIHWEGELEEREAGDE
jgi:hypothetical protein